VALANVWRPDLSARDCSEFGGWVAAEEIGIPSVVYGVLAWMPPAAFGGVVGAIAPGADLGVRLTIPTAVALAAVSYLHVVFGELAPKGSALRHPAQLARWLLPPLMLFAFLATPFTSLLAKSAQLVLSALGQRGDLTSEDRVHSPDELRLLVEQSQEGGALEQQDADLLDAVFEFSEKNAREVMTPRTEIVALPSDATLDATLAVVVDGGFSRYPVYTETIDNIVGVLLAKDLLPVARAKPILEATDAPDSKMSFGLHQRHCLRPIMPS